jgi:hypothetical protein
VAAACSAVMKSPPLPLLGALGEQLLELVDHQQQPARP